MSAAKQLRELLETGRVLLAPGVFDGLSARLVERGGFSVVYASGGAIARSAGLPDIGLLTMKEVVDRLEQIVAVTDLPVIADADTGYGNALNVQRTVESFERAGVAGLHLEDQQFPKRCGHLNNKTLISMDEMCHKIDVARRCVIDPNFVIIARTDAIAVEGFDMALKRARAYAEAGADVIFVEAPETLEQIEMIAKKIPQPKLINMFYGGKTPLVPLERLEEMGYQIVIIPSDLQRAAIRAMENVLSTIKHNGDSAELAAEIATFQERESIVQTKEYLKIDQDFSNTKAK